MSRITLYNTEIPPTQPVSGSGQVTVFAKDKAIYSIDEDGTLSGPFGGPGAAYRWSVVIPTFFFRNLSLRAQAVPSGDPGVARAPEPTDFGFPVSDPAAKSVVGFSFRAIYSELEEPLTIILYKNGEPTALQVTVPVDSTAVVSSTGSINIDFEDTVWFAPEDPQQGYDIEGFFSVTFANVPVPA